MKTRVIGFGNSILRDDGVGIHTAREIARRVGPGVDVVESEVAGFALMELMAGWDRVILVDSVQFEGVEPGTVLKLKPEDLHTSLRLRSVHDIDFPTALELGRRMGLLMPSEILVFAIQIAEAHTFGETMTAAATAGMSKAVSQILDEIGAGP